MSNSRIYLDNAATSWPKPPGVPETLAQYYRDCGAPSGRGVYSQAIDVQRKIGLVRKQIAKMINANEPNSIVFTFNGTDGLNMVINGLLGEGDHALATVTEHNSVLRPLQMLRQYKNIESDLINCDSTGMIDPGEFKRVIRSNTKLICINHASNVTGTIQPVQEILEIAKNAGVPVLIDAAQSLGHVPIDVEHLDCEFLASSGHKGLLGPLGTGVLFIKTGCEQMLVPTRSGGTGSKSDQAIQPLEMPDRFESGNLDVAAIFALATALTFLESDQARSAKLNQKLVFDRLCEGLAGIKNIRCYGPTDPEQKVCVLSVQPDRYDPREFSTMLDSAANVQTRPGLHCAPLIHKAIGSFEKGGTVRFSPGLFNTIEQIDATIELVAALA